MESQIKNQKSKMPVLAIVGRPNVGKSSVFNWLATRRIAIVEPTAGVTRDRVSTVVTIGGRGLELIDTGGMGIQDVDNLTDEIEGQIRTAMKRADIILFVVDARDGVTTLDEMVAQRLRAAKKPILVLANKCDTPRLEPAALEFFQLGFPHVLAASAHQGRNKTRLVEWIERHLPASDGESTPGDVELKLAIVGRRNTGKSTFINCLAEEERMIVSEVAGTTRDSVDVRFEQDGKTFIAIDTAGVRKKSHVSEPIEYYSLHRAERSIRRADVVLLFFDAQHRISKVDKQLVAYILENHKPAILVVNKWDLLRPMPTGEFADYIRATFPTLDYVPMAFITAKKGKNVRAVLNLAQNLHKQASARVGTGDLNRVVRRAVEEQDPPLRQNRRPRIFYATQAATNPPTIVLFTNGPDLFDDWYKRYLFKQFRDQLPFSEVPIKLYLRNHREDRRSEDGDSSAPVRVRKRPESKLTTAHKDVTKEAKAKPRPRKKERIPELWKDV